MTAQVWELLQGCINPLYMDVFMQHGGIYLYMGTCSWNGHMQAIGQSPVATVVITHSHVQLHYNTQAEKQGIVARPQARQNVGRCRDGENVFKVSAC